MHDWHSAAASGFTMPPTKAPHVTPHWVSQRVAMHALSVDTVGADEGNSSKHFAQHCGSPLHGPKHFSKAAHDGSVAHALDSGQQLAETHEAHDVVP
jgi:hypothetical protein